MIKTFVSRAIATGFIVAACVGATAVPASAEPGRYTGAGVIHLHDGVQFGEGKIIDGKDMATVEMRADAEGAPSALVATWDFFDFDAIAAAEYPILKDGTDSGYFMVLTITTGHHSALTASASCTVFKGRPSDGGDALWGAPFSCDSARHGLDYDWDFEVRASKKR
jgi:hypothetical protein